MTSLFETIKERIDIKDAATRYGIAVDSRGKALCFAHGEKTPSLVFKGSRFKCFGCGVGGDVIDLVCAIRGVSTLTAARELARLYGLPVFADRPLTTTEWRQAKVADAQRKRDASRLKAFEAWSDNAGRVLAEYLRNLDAWKRDFAPERPGDDLHPLFIEALRVTEYWADLFLDVFVGGGFEEKVDFYQAHGNEVQDIGQRFKQRAKAVSA